MKEKSTIHSKMWHLLPLLLFAGFVITLARGAAPGFSAGALAGHLGLSPFPPTSHPLWGLVIRILAFLPLGDTVRAANLFSAVCATLTAVLFFLLVKRWCVFKALAGVDHGPALERAGTLAALFATAVLVSCIPFWIIATRAHPAAFDLLLLLLALYLTRRFADSPKLSILMAFSLLWGLGTTEFATFITLSPLMGALWMFLLWRAEMLKPKTIGLAILLYAAGTSVYFLQAWAYYRSPAFEWRAFGGYFQLLRIIWRDQYWAITRSTGPSGWILIFMGMVFPWILTSLLPTRGPRVVRYGAGTYFLFLVLSGLAILVVLNLPPAPWFFLHSRPFLVTPYLFFAAWAGYVAALWYVILAGRKQFDSAPVLWIKKVLRPIYLPLLGALIVVAVIRNYPVIDTRYGDKVHALAEEMVKSLDGRTWIISGGIMEDHLCLAAAERDIPLKVLNLRLTQAKSYLKYAASLFDDLRLKGLAEMGLSPLLKEWFEDQPSVCDKVAVVSATDLWLLSGYTVYPNGPLFMGALSPDDIDIDACLRTHENLWQSYTKEVVPSPPEQNVAMPWYAWVRRHMSKVSNNLGILLEDGGQSDAAFEAYSEARAIDTNNVSALLNMVSLSEREDRPEKEAVGNEFEEFADSLKSKLGIWGLSYNYGYVRSPEAYAQRGFVWAMSGKPNVAIREIRRAIELGADESRYQLTLASLYYAGDEEEKSRQAYLAILKEDPENTSVLLALAKISTRRNDFDAARGYLQKLKELGVPPAVVKFEEAALEVLSGHIEQGKAILEELIEKDAGNYKAWSVLALLSLQLGQNDVVEKAVKILSAQTATYPSLNTTIARIAQYQGDYEKARASLNALLRVRPRSIKTLEQLLRLDLAQHEREKAEKHVEQILNLDSRNALANYALGSLQVSRGEYALAEESYRISVNSKRRPGVLNDLAYLLQMRGLYDKALELVRESLEMNNRQASAWDTYGYILLQQGNLHEAEEALTVALGFTPENPEMIYHMALLHEKRGEREEALRVATPLIDRITEMRPGVYEEVRELLGRLRGG